MSKRKKRTGVPRRNERRAGVNTFVSCKSRDHMRWLFSLETTPIPETLYDSCLLECLASTLYQPYFIRRTRGSISKSYNLREKDSKHLELRWRATQAEGVDPTLSIQRDFNYT